MPKIYLDGSDGRYYTRRLTEEEAAGCEAKGIDVAYIADTVWETYQRDCERAAIWQAFWQAISNEQSMRRREKALMPLEAAEAKIAQLENDLAQARRMWSHFEGEYARVKGGDPAPLNDYTCVFPKPGCNIEALPIKWQASAVEILGTYRTDLGTKHQYCCCGDDHEKIDEATAQRLRDSGFVVRHQTEVCWNE